MGRGPEAENKGQKQAIATAEEPHPNPDLAKGRGPEAENKGQKQAIATAEEPHPNPDLAKGRGPEEVLLRVTNLLLSEG
ncbi:hypothetical protein [Oscillatoria sp. HE19RPO]|uniref:hypothetical protein n=1 Tax=Oscillatoria sp. HE19RPO TaxID=2954806 RepID=UPI0020C1F606|nr:hypothetical protein [Oscillatoria sp. HE19RPO]